MAMTTFAFVDHSLIDRKARRAIRSHVMKGKNLGKVRTKRPPHAARDTAHDWHDVNASTGDSLSPTPAPFDKPKVCPKLIAQVGNELSGLASACEMTVQSRRAVHDCEL